MKKNFSTLILCGGKGRRLGALGKSKPKSLVKIDKNPVLKSIINLIPKKISPVIYLSGFYMFDKIKSYIKKNNFKNIKLYNDGDIEILQRIKINLVRSGHSIIVLYGDELADVNFNTLIKNHIHSKKLLTITTYKFYSNFGFLKKKNKKFTFLEKPYLGNFNIGFMIFDYKNLKYIGNGKKLQNYINKLCKINQVNEYNHRGYHTTFNSIDELENARKYIRKIYEKK